MSCRSFAANAVRLQLHALAYNLGNFLRTLATPELIKDRQGGHEVAAASPKSARWRGGEAPYRAFSQQFDEVPYMTDRPGEVVA
jgi:hypothetical protein